MRLLELIKHEMSILAGKSYFLAALEFKKNGI